MRQCIVHVTGCLDMGGQEKLLVEFARHAHRDRFDLHFVSLGSRGVLADELEGQGWSVTALDLGPGLHWNLPFRLAKLFRSWQAAVVHTHNERPLLYAAPAARLMGARCIHTKHGRGTGISPRQSRLAAFVSGLTDRFVCVSDDCARLAIEQGVRESRVVTLHNGIDVERFAFSGPCLNGPAIIVARLCRDKDHATLLHAVALAAREAPEFHLDIVGDGPCRGDLQELAARLGIASNVRFLGMSQNIPALLQRARMFVLSSISEGVPLTILEAMACGLPVVATRVGGIPEIVTHGKTGLLVPASDPMSLAAALLRLYREDHATQEMGVAGRNRAESEFEVRRMVARYEQLYRLARNAHPAGAKPVLLSETSGR